MKSKMMNSVGLIGKQPEGCARSTMDQLASVHFTVFYPIFIFRAELMAFTIDHETCPIGINHQES